MSQINYFIEKTDNAIVSNPVCLGGKYVFGETEEYNGGGFMTLNQHIMIDMKKMMMMIQKLKVIMMTIFRNLLIFV